MNTDNPINPETSFDYLHGQLRATLAALSVLLHDLNEHNDNKGSSLLESAERGFASMQDDSRSASVEKIAFDKGVSDGFKLIRQYLQA